MTSNTFSRVPAASHSRIKSLYACIRQRRTPAPIAQTTATTRIRGRQKNQRRLEDLRSTLLRDPRAKDASACHLHRYSRQTLRVLACMVADNGRRFGPVCVVSCTSEVDLFNVILVRRGDSCTEREVEDLGSPPLPLLKRPTQRERAQTLVLRSQNIATALGSVSPGRPFLCSGSGSVACRWPSSLWRSDGILRFL